MVELDHILWAAPDLDEGVRLFETLTGVTPVRGGSHPGFGTRNYLAGLGQGLYFEIISPDPAQSLAGNRGGQIAALPHPGLLAFALRSTDLDSARRAAERSGLACEGPVYMTRTRPDGVTLAWSILYLRHAELGEAVPFIIDWGASPHPSTSTPEGCTLKSFVALRPDPEPLAAAYRAIGAPVEVKRGERPGFLAVLDTPRGEVVFTNP
jgi:hypothetical protein